MDCGDCSKCGDTESARHVCPTGALTVTGRRIGSEDLLREVLKDEVFFRSSGGGVCFSGGEPLTQAPFCAELGSLLKEKDVPVSLESCLHVPWSAVEKVIPVVDEFFCDLKHGDPLIFREQTGGDLSLILDNLRRLDDRNVPVRIRIPVIYGFNHSEEDIRSILKILSPLRHIKGVDLMPYHPLGAGKHSSLNMSYKLPLNAMPPEELAPYRELVQSFDHTVTIGGLT
jgi:pyruvate formate lyase activating enzyme